MIGVLAVDLTLSSLSQWNISRVAPWATPVLTMVSLFGLVTVLEHSLDVGKSLVTQWCVHVRLLSSRIPLRLNCGRVVC